MSSPTLDDDRTARRQALEVLSGYAYADAEGDLPRLLSPIVFEQVSALFDGLPIREQDADVVKQRLVHHARTIVSLAFLSSVGMTLAHEQGQQGEPLDVPAILSALGALSEQS